MEPFHKAAAAVTIDPQTALDIMDCLTWLAEHEDSLVQGAYKLHGGHNAAYWDFVDELTTATQTAKVLASELQPKVTPHYASNILSNVRREFARLSEDQLAEVIKVVAHDLEQRRLF